MNPILTYSGFNGQKWVMFTDGMKIKQTVSWRGRPQGNVGRRKRTADHARKSEALFLFQISFMIRTLVNVLEFTRSVLKYNNLNS